MENELCQGEELKPMVAGDNDNEEEEEETVEFEIEVISSAASSCCTLSENALSDEDADDEAELEMRCQPSDAGEALARVVREETSCVDEPASGESGEEAPSRVEQASLVQEPEVAVEEPQSEATTSLDEQPEEQKADQSEHEEPEEHENEAPGEAPGEASGEAPGEAPGETSGEAPGETSGEATGETPGEATSETPGEATSETPGEASQSDLQTNQVEPEAATIDKSAAQAHVEEEPEVDVTDNLEAPRELAGGQEEAEVEIAPANDLISVEQQIDCPPAEVTQVSQLVRDSPEVTQDSRMADSPEVMQEPSDIAVIDEQQPEAVELCAEKEAAELPAEKEADDLIECPHILERFDWKSLSDDWLILDEAGDLIIEQVDKLISLSADSSPNRRTPVEVEDRIEQQDVNIEVSAVAPLQVILNEPNDDDDPRSCSPSTPGDAGGGGACSPSSHELEELEEQSRQCFGSVSSLTGGCYEEDYEDYEDSLEREFDQEPEFERREVVVKRNRDPREEYTLSDELGRGKFGTVFRCTEMASGRQLAAKFISMRRREDREDVEREVAIMSVLQHKRLLQLYDAFDDGIQEMCLITELVEGGELFERIVDDDFELTERKAAIFMRQICEGVEYMQSENIVHLDMKPENILCLSRTSARIKLIDFGLARRLEPGKAIRVMFGTPDFAAPEVLGYEQVSLATDMWSVGVICYVLLSGLSPFMGDSDLDTMANVTRATYDFNDSAFEPISELAKDFISKLLVRAPEERLKPTECLNHPWLARGGGGGGGATATSAAASLMPIMSDQRRRSSVASLGLHRLALEQVAALAAGTSTPPPPPDSLIHRNYQHRASIGAESTASSGAISLDKRRLKRYVVRRKWHKTVHAIMALNRMGARLSAQLTSG